MNKYKNKYKHRSGSKKKVPSWLKKKIDAKKDTKSKSLSESVDHIKKAGKSKMIKQKSLLKNKVSKVREPSFNGAIDAEIELVMAKDSIDMKEIGSIKNDVDWASPPPWTSSKRAASKKAVKFK